MGNFNNLRVWRGEQSRAFEELCYQLLKEDGPQGGTRPIRTGNPDGGVEWYSTLDDGTEWGWQAKHVHGIDNLLGAMTDSVKRVVQERPQLRKLTFVISWNLTTGTSGGTRTSQRQKYEAKKSSWLSAIPQTAAIEFDLIQESDLLDLLSRPEHAGRRAFWWGETVLTDERLVEYHAVQANAAGERYRPDLQVDLPIQADLLALGFDVAIQKELTRRTNAVRAALRRFPSLPDTADDESLRLHRETLASAEFVRASLATFSITPDWDPATLDTVVASAESCRDLLVAAALREQAAAQTNDESPHVKHRWALESSAYILRQALGSLLDWFASSIGQAFTRQTYFLTGPAGSGKTHLFLDATARALAAGRPAIFLAGARFGQPAVWSSVAEQTGLGPMGADELLQAMDSAGEASSVSGSRFIIFIDALNETTPADFWTKHLPALRAKIEQYPHVALAVSCRDTYESLVLDRTERDRYLRCRHPGFAGREVEATQRYFEHYKLEGPRIPLLTPEFTVPLFLKLYCESLQGTSKDLQPVGHEGRLEIFGRYLDTKMETIARRLRPEATSTYEIEACQRDIAGVVTRLLDAMAHRGREALGLEEAEAVVRDSAADAPGAHRRILGLLQEEGVVTREMLYLGNGGNGDGLRITFQAFSDYLLLKRRVELSDDPLADEALRLWLANTCTWGIREAALVYFPEVFGVELLDLLLKDTTSNDAADGAEREDRRQEYERELLYRRFVEMLPYRRASAITERSIELLNQAQAYVSRSDFFRALIMCAPQPGNRLNGDGLHTYLLKFEMPQRDADFGIALYWEIYDSTSPLPRLARWAAAGPYRAYEPQVIELSAIPLIWCLGSSNRILRDWVTKALVQLLRGHLDVLLSLLERFWTVNDPYVVQRVLVIVYGALLRSERGDAQAKALVDRVAQLVFTPPVRPDELMLDAARGVLRWGVRMGHLAEEGADVAKRPYGLRKPGNAPTKDALEEKYGWKDDQPDNESYARIWTSLFGGDFGYYVVDAAVRRFSRYETGKPYRGRATNHEPKLIVSRWRTFLSSLDKEQRSALDSYLRDADPGQLLGLMYQPNADAGITLSHGQWSLLVQAFRHPKQMDDEYPAGRSNRWIMRRTVTLGWSPELFGREDRTIGHGLGRESNKAERWGKKYQWIAFHELMARMLDNYQLRQAYLDDEIDEYDGLHRMTDARQIDPTLPPIEYRQLVDDDVEEASPWGDVACEVTIPPSPLDFSAYAGNGIAFMSDRRSEPEPDALVILTDTSGDQWVVLEGNYVYRDPAGEAGWGGLTQRASVWALFVPTEHGERILSVLKDWNLHNVIDFNGHIDCCYVQEVGRLGPDCAHRHAELQTLDEGSLVFEAVHATESYTWEGSAHDCSLKGAARLTMPSTFVQDGLNLDLDTRGPSWLDAHGRIALVHCVDSETGSSALLMHRGAFQRLLKARGVEMLVFASLRRFESKSNWGRNEPQIEWTVEGRLDSELGRHWHPAIRQEFNLERTAPVKSAHGDAE